MRCKGRAIPCARGFMAGRLPMIRRHSTAPHHGAITGLTRIFGPVFVGGIHRGAKRAAVTAKLVVCQQSGGEFGPPFPRASAPCRDFHGCEACEIYLCPEALQPSALLQPAKL